MAKWIPSPKQVVAEVIAGLILLGLIWAWDSLRPPGSLVSQVIISIVVVLAVAIIANQAIHMWGQHTGGDAAAAQTPPLSEALSVKKEERWTNLDRGYGWVGKYLCFRCSNDSQREISNCRIRVEDLEGWWEPGEKWVRRVSFNPLTLAWSFNDGGGETKAIPTESSRTCDFVCHERGNGPAIILAAQESLRGLNQIPFGKWRGRCHVEADGYVPFDFEAEFLWEARYAEVGLTRVEMRTLDFIGELRVLDRADSRKESA